jgi:hypothetical protein
MPIHKVAKGWKWGSHGHTYSTRKGAEKQAAAAHANGFRGDRTSLRNYDENWFGQSSGATQYEPFPDSRQDSALIDDIISGLEADYPPEAIQWVKAAKWEGPEKVPLDEIDFSGRKRWRASKDDLTPYIDNIKKGKRKPILLVVVPGREKYIIVDGHHRALAYEELDKPALAYCAHVDHHEGPWDTMHDQQKNGASGSYPPTA